MGVAGRRVVAWGLMVAIGYGLETAAGQAPPAASPPAAGGGVEIFFDAIDVELVDLEVWVRDGDTPVTGLTADDFVVLEDGQPVALTHFAVVEPVAGSAPATGADEVAAVEQFAPEVAGDGAGDAFLLSLLIDQDALPRHAGQIYLPAIEELVARSLRPVDRAMLTVCERQCRTVLEPTTDRQRLLQAVEESLKPGARSLASALQRQRILSGIASTPDPLSASGTGSLSGRDDPGYDEAMRDSLAGDIATWVREREDGMRTTLAGVVRHLATLAGVPGRRLVLYVGEGLQTRFAEPLVEAWRNQFERNQRVLSSAQLPSTLDRHLVQAIGEVAAVANAVGVTISAMSSGSAALGAGVSAEDGASIGIAQAASDAIDQQEALSMLVVPTGGSVVFKVSDVAVDRLAGAMWPDYVLGYAASTSDASARRIEVRLRPEVTAGRRLEVRHRAGRQARDAETRMRDRVTAAVLYGAEANPLEIIVEPGAATPEKDAVSLGVTVRFPLGNVVLLPRGGFHEGRLSVYFAARDAQGRSSPVTRTELPLRIPNDRLATALGQTAAYETKLTLRAEKHDLVVGVRDEIGGVESTVRAAWSPDG